MKIKPVEGCIKYKKKYYTDTFECDEKIANALLKSGLVKKVFAPETKKKAKSKEKKSEDSDK